MNNLQSDNSGRALMNVPHDDNVVLTHGEGCLPVVRSFGAERRGIWQRNSRPTRCRKSNILVELFTIEIASVVSLLASTCLANTQVDVITSPQAQEPPGWSATSFESGNGAAILGSCFFLVPMFARSSRNDYLRQVLCTFSYHAKTPGRAFRYEVKRGSSLIIRGQVKRGQGCLACVGRAISGKIKNRTTYLESLIGFVSR